MSYIVDLSLRGCHGLWCKMADRTKRSEEKKAEKRKKKSERKAAKKAKKEKEEKEAKELKQAKGALAGSIGRRVFGVAFGTALLAGLPFGLDLGLKPFPASKRAKHYTIIVLRAQHLWRISGRWNSCRGSGNTPNVELGPATSVMPVMSVMSSMSWFLMQVSETERIQRTHENACSVMNLTAGSSQSTKNVFRRALGCRVSTAWQTDAVSTAGHFRFFWRWKIDGNTPGMAQLHRTWLQNDADVGSIGRPGSRTASKWKSRWRMMAWSLEIEVKDDVHHSFDYISNFK